MEIINREVWLSSDELFCIGVKEKTITMGVLRLSPLWQSQKDPTDGRKRLIRYNTLADKYKQLVIDKLCEGLEPKRWMAEEKLREAENRFYGRLNDACKSDYLAKRLFYNNFRLSLSHLDSVCRAASVLDVIANWYEENNIPFSCYGPINMAAAWLEVNDRYFAVKCLPFNPIRMKEKLKEYLKLQSPINLTVLIKNRPEKIEVERWWHGVALYLLNQNKNSSQASILVSIKELSLMNNEKCPMRKTLSLFLRKQKGYILNDRNVKGHKNS
jgi:hypothetical protein